MSRVANLVLSSLLFSITASIAHAQVADPASPPDTTVQQALETLSKVTDQADTFECWAVASTARFDAIASLHLGQMVKLSPKYIFYVRTRIDVVAQILGKNFEEYVQGGLYSDALEIAKRYGVMTEAAYPWVTADGKPFTDDKALFADLNRFIEKFSRQADKLDFSSPTVERRALRGVTEILDRHLGRPPERFAFRDQMYTPMRFFRRGLKSLVHTEAKEIIFGAGRPESWDIYEGIEGASHRTFSTSDHGKIMRVLEESLKARERVLIQYKIVDYDTTHQRGIISFKEHGAKVPDPKTFDRGNPDYMDHYVVATDAKWTRSGRIRDLLIRNSIETSAAQGHGYHWIKRDYLFLIEAVEISDSMFTKLVKAGLIPKI